jgi:hypothetical protein
VLGVSADSPFPRGEFRDEHGIEFDLVSDTSRDVVRAYDPAIDLPDLGPHGVANHAVFVLDGDGTVRYRRVAADPTTEPPYDAVLEAVESLRERRDVGPPRRVCPRTRTSASARSSRRSRLASGRSSWRYPFTRRGLPWTSATARSPSSRSMPSRSPRRNDRFSAVIASFVRATERSPRARSASVR